MVLKYKKNGIVFLFGGTTLNLPWRLDFAALVEFHVFPFSLPLCALATFFHVQLIVLWFLPLIIFDLCTVFARGQQLSLASVLFLVQFSIFYRCCTAWSHTILFCFILLPRWPYCVVTPLNYSYYSHGARSFIRDGFIRIFSFLFPFFGFVCLFFHFNVVYLTKQRQFFKRLSCY